MKYIWKLTDEEVAECEQKGWSVAELQEARKRAYITNGGVILNPDALEDMYEALKLTRDNLQTLSDAALHYRKTFSANLVVLNQAIAKAEIK